MGHLESSGSDATIRSITLGSTITMILDASFYNHIMFIVQVTSKARVFVPDTTVGSLNKHYILDDFVNAQ